MMWIFLWAFSIFGDIEMMYWVAWRIGLAERIACAVLMVMHLFLFFGYCFLEYIKTRNENETIREETKVD